MPSGNTRRRYSRPGTVRPRESDRDQGVVDLVAPSLSPEQEKGLADAIDEADKGDLVDGAAAFAKLRGRVRDAG
jgi:hypothetical protein